jgi:hypothetical protein
LFLRFMAGSNWGVPAGSRRLKSMRGYESTCSCDRELEINASGAGFSVLVVANCGGLSSWLRYLAKLDGSCISGQ